MPNFRTYDFVQNPMQDYDTALKMSLNDSCMDGRETGFTVSIEIVSEPVYVGGYYGRTNLMSEPKVEIMYCARKVAL